MAGNEIPNASETFPDPANCPDIQIGPGNQAAEPSGSWPYLSCESEQAIHDVVVRLLQETRSDDERRWSPRTPYVRLARVYFEQPEDRVGDSSGGVLVATTDISLEGVGVLCWQEIPVRRLQLELPGARFTCEVCWSKRIGHHVYRYGLSFRRLLDKAN